MNYYKVNKSMFSTHIKKEQYFPGGGLRVRLPMQGTWVGALVWEDTTCHGATGPMRHSC